MFFRFSIFIVCLVFHLILFRRLFCWCRARSRVLVRSLLSAALPFFYVLSFVLHLIGLAQVSFKHTNSLNVKENTKNRFWIIRFSSLLFCLSLLTIFLYICSFFFSFFHSFAWFLLFFLRFGCRVLFFFLYICLMKCMFNYDIVYDDDDNDDNDTESHSFGLFLQ